MSIPVPDAGLQPERTAMSWTRTALAMLACSMTLLRWSGPYPAIVFAAIGLLALISLILFALNRRIYSRQATRLSNEYAAPNTVGVALMTLALTLLGGISLVLLVIAA